MATNLPCIDILFAEDDIDDVIIFEMALKGTFVNFQIRHVSNGAHLMSLLYEATLTILLLDIRMPLKDGIECLTEIRNDSRFNQLPVIIYTSLEPEYYVEAAYCKGANFYIQKTASFEEMVTKLKYVLTVDWTPPIIYPSATKFVI